VSLPLPSSSSSLPRLSGFPSRSDASLLPVGCCPDRSFNPCNDVTAEDLCTQSCRLEAEDVFRTKSSKENAACALSLSVFLSPCLPSQAPLRMFIEVVASVLTAELETNDDHSAAFGRAQKDDAQRIYRASHTSTHAVNTNAVLPPPPPPPPPARRKH
jgi:hypothetical protein